MQMENEWEMAIFMALTYLSKSISQVQIFRQQQMFTCCMARMPQTACAGLKRQPTEFSLG